MNDRRDIPVKNPPKMMGGRMGQHSNVKSKDFKGTWIKLLSYNKRCLPAIIISLICAMVGTIFTLLGPNKLSDLTDIITEGIMGNIDLDKIAGIGFLLIFFYGISAVLTLTQGWIMATVTQIIAKKLRTSISKKINKLPMWFYNRTSIGDILSRVTNDVDTIAYSLNMSVGTLITSSTLLVGSLIMMLISNVIMTVTAVVTTLIGFGLMRIIMKNSQKYFALQQKNLGDINGHIEETYTGHDIVKVYNAEKEVKVKFTHYNKQLKDSAFKAQALSGAMMPVMHFMGNFGYVCVCIVGALLTMNNLASFGVIVAFMIYIRYFTQPLSQIAQAMQALQSAAAAGERVFEFLEAEEVLSEENKIQSLDNIKGYVKFEHVKFGYEDTDKIVINDFSAQAKPGQKIAIVGPTGAGKTTLVNLLMRFNEIKSGNIYIDDISIKELSREAVRSQFCMVLQDTWLFEGSIWDNLIYCKKDATKEEVIDACKAVGIEHFIKTLPQGYDTVLDECINISQGQRQQITIARAMIANRPMLILDEATSSVDTRTEIQIQNAMDALMQNRTSFVIAHRLSTIKNADLILVLNNGDVVESGTHEELLQKNGFYAKLYNSQFENIS